jgi:hypothetical protein
MTNASSGPDRHLPEPASNNVLRPHLSAPWGVRLGRNRRERMTSPCSQDQVDTLVVNRRPHATNSVRNPPPPPRWRVWLGQTGRGGPLGACVQVQADTLTMDQRPQAI